MLSITVRSPCLTRFTQLLHIDVLIHFETRQGCAMARGERLWMPRFAKASRMGLSVSWLATARPFSLRILAACLDGRHVRSRDGA